MTGGAGFIGSNLVESLINKVDEIIIVDDLSMGLKSNLPSSNKISFYEKSITDYKFMKELLVNERPDYIFLLGAVASVADSVAHPIYTHEVNQNANLFILETIRQNKIKIKKILFASSAAVYGDVVELPKRENSEVRPLTPYAIDKFATERFVIDYGKLYGLPTVAVRFFNVYGPKQNPKSPYSGVLSIISDKIINDKCFTIFGNGEQTRDFVFVDDVIHALLLLIDSDLALNTVYNIATGRAVSLNQVLSSYEIVTGKTLAIDYSTPRSGDIEHSLADISKITSLGFVPKYDITSGLAKYWQSLTDK
ncbi:NAD-dependent epimerase/dehydratase family protein [Lactobacillus buchneri]|nr:NAD-dependent epimerase/dehydratase family protein [Lentilactobacillus buchneri]